MAPAHDTDPMTLAATLQAELLRRGAMLATAESLTGGRLGDVLSAAPGSSDTYLGGEVSYATEVKQKVLGVSPETVERHGVVSAECAAEMARGVRDLIGRPGRGFLSGRFTSPDDFPEGDFRSSHPRFQGENFARNLELVDRVREIAEEKGVTPGQLALAWVLHRGDDIVPIPGTTAVRHLAENASALAIELTDDDLERIDDAAPPGVAAGDRYSDMSTIDA